MIGNGVELMNRYQKVIIAAVAMTLLTAASTTGQTGQWQLTDVKREIKPDRSYAPAEWRGDGNGAIAAHKKWKAPNSDVTAIINSVFEWQGIPGAISPNEPVKVTVKLNQLVNNESGYGSWIKIYYNEVGGIEADGPEVALGRHDGGKSASAEGFIKFNPSGKHFRIRVHCSVGQDIYEVYYFYSFSEKPDRRPSVNLAYKRPSTQSSMSQWSRAGDAQGAVDGIKNGSYGFHTNREPRPWWQVDLGQVKPLTEIRVFNRLDYNPERSRTLHVLLSNDGSNWRLAYRHNGGIFGGKDGKPLIVSLKGLSARFVRLQLDETTWFHLDEVEIY